MISLIGIHIFLTFMACLVVRKNQFIAIKAYAAILLIGLAVLQSTSIRNSEWPILSIIIIIFECIIGIILVIKVVKSMNKINNDDRMG